MYILVYLSTIISEDDNNVRFSKDGTIKSAIIKILSNLQIATNYAWLAGANVMLRSVGESPMLHKRGEKGSTIFSRSGDDLV